MPPTVEELFDRWRSQRDHRALAAVFDRTASEVWRVARHLSGNRSEADDLLQATFLAAMESAGHWRRTQPLVPWLLGILTNKLRVTRRRQRQRQARQPELLATRPAPAPSDPVADASHGELREHLKERLAELPEVYRAVLVLQLEHGLSALEIADALGRPRATVRSQLQRGLELLRRLLPRDLRAPANERPDLRAVRAAVLMAAGGSATVVPLSVGITVMAKKLMLGVALVLAAGLWYGWPRATPLVPTPKAPASTPVATAPETVRVLEQATEPPTTARTPVVAPPRSTGALRVHVRWADGAPAAAMGVCLQPLTANDWFAQSWQTTDVGGVTEYGDLPPGKMVVRAGHGGTAEAVCVAGATTDVTLTIPQGIDVRGTVVDPDGALVGHAILAVGRSDEDVLEVARTDANGAFFLRSVAAGNRVVAYADGFAGSQVLGAAEFADGPKELRLAGLAATVTGRVFDADGRPLAAAWVAHGYASSGGHFGGPDGKPRLTAMRTVLTDAAGEFRLQAVPLGMAWPLHAGAFDHATWKGSVRATTADTPFVEIRLQRAVQLHGTVRDKSGAPVRGHVSVIDRNSPGKGIGDQRPQWGRPFVGTRTDGVYAFRNLPAGELVVSAGDNHGKVASRTFQAQPGDELEWDPVLVGDLAIRGRLLDDGGQPVPGWRVVARGPEGQPTPSDDTTDRDGSFVLRGCAEVAYTVRCYANGDWHQAIVEQRGVEPGGESLLLRVSRAAMPTCFVLGRLADDETVAGVRVLLVGERSGLLMSEPLQPGDTFELGPMPPERFALQLQRLASDTDAGAPLVVALGDHQLRAGERLDLGTVRTPSLGELHITLVDAAGQPVAKGTVPLALLGAPMGGIGVEIVAGRGSRKLAPGTYLPTSGINRFAIEHAPIVIVAGQRTDARLQVADAVHRQVRYDLTAPGVPIRADATWKKAGQPLQRHWFGFWQEHPTTIDHHFTPGEWELELELGTGVVQRFPFVVTADASGPLIEIKVSR